jgi:fermentation-respiration switch protein FrsA (DUF1100 family)
LAEAGYIAIAADAAYQGASGGEPRHTDKPTYRIEDIHGMADFITQYAGVDANRLGVFGIKSLYKTERIMETWFVVVYQIGYSWR